MKHTSWIPLGIALGLFATLGLSAGAQAEDTSSLQLIREHQLTIRILYAPEWGAQQTTAKRSGILQVFEDSNKVEGQNPFRCRFTLRTGPKPQEKKDFACVFTRAPEGWEKIDLAPAVAREMLGFLVGDRAPVIRDESGAFAFAITRWIVPRMIGEFRRLDPNYWLDVQIGDNTVRGLPYEE